MKKIALIGGILVVLVIVFLVVGLSSLGTIIKTAVNEYGPQMTKTEVSLRDVDISIFSGEAALKDFRLGNPKGFKSPHAISVGNISVDVDEKSLTGDTIIIDKIEVVAPEIIYERALKSDNFQALLKNLQGTAAKEKTAAKKTGEDSGGKKIMIRDFLLKDATLTLATTIMNVKSASAKIPDIHLKDLGTKDDGLTPAEAFEKIVAALYKTITSPGVSNALKQSLKDLGDDIKAAGEDAKKQLKATAEDVKKQAETVEEDLKTAGEDVEGQLKDTEKQLEGDIDALKGMFD